MPDLGRLDAGDPERIGGYRLTGVLGEGGQGKVYLGQDSSGSSVAVKVLHARVSADPAIRERFQREAQFARRVAAFCTAQVLDAGIAGERPYLISEYVPGPSLHELVATGGPRTGGGLERLAIATATALEAIHQVGIVHRDFKPGNVIMGPEGPVVIDFGIARILGGTATTHSMLVGTPGYMAPEQFAGQPAGPASDLFSWAATMVYGATGHPAFSGQHPAGVMGAILGREPDLDGVPDRLRSLLAACLAKDPDARPPVGDVLAVLTGRAPASHPPGGERSDPPKAGRTALEPTSTPPAPSPPRLTPRAGALPGGAASTTDPGSEATTPYRGSDAAPASPKPAAPSRRRVAYRALAVAAVIAAVGLGMRLIVFAPSDTALAGRSGTALTGHSAPVTAVAVTQLDGRPVAVSAGDDTVRVWDLTTRKQIGEPLTGHTDKITSVAVGQLNARPVAVSAGWDRTVRVWDLATHEQIGQPLTGHTDKVASVAVGQLNSRSVAVSSSPDGTVRVWDLAEGEQISELAAGHIGGSTSVATGALNGRPVAISSSAGSSSWDRTVRVWDLATRKQLGEPFIGHAEGVTSVAVGQLDARPVAVSAGWDRTVRVWDLATREQLGQPLTGHTDKVASVAVGQVDGRLVAVSASWDRTIRVWDLATRKQLGQPLTGHTGSVNSVAVGQVDGRLVAVSGGYDATVRVWDLAAHRQSSE
ncbi:WD40 repeat domain-containing serine/threonine protein kinase [Streptosporangium canum]|uniref:WD40 repeat domain-containing serine/threonine protein kinase n=1 Tax=Streptosporangium canum TaxID=324952 RepID=UPI0036800393